MFPAIALILGVTALGAASDPAVLSAAAVALAGAPLEFEALDVAWKAGRGGLLARCAGREATRRAHRAARLMRVFVIKGVHFPTMRGRGDTTARREQDKECGDDAFHRSRRVLDSSRWPRRKVGCACSFSIPP